MCEIHFYRCNKCGRDWVACKKLTSCDSDKMEIHCPESLCMYVGNMTRPETAVCTVCRGSMGTASILYVSDPERKHGAGQDGFKGDNTSAGDRQFSRDSVGEVAEQRNT